MPVVAGAVRLGVVTIADPAGVVCVVHEADTEFALVPDNDAIKVGEPADAVALAPEEAEFHVNVIACPATAEIDTPEEAPDAATSVTSGP